MDKGCFGKTRKIRAAKQTFLLRPIDASDLPKMKKLFESFSPETIRKRFFEKIRDMSEDLLKRYCVLNHQKEIAIVAELQSKEKPLVGVARACIVDANSAEVAIVVTDAYQRKGIGKKLMLFLEEALAERGIARVFAYIEPSNAGAIEFFRKIGYSVKSLQGDFLAEKFFDR